jgi:hypothetical protein
MKAIFKRAVAAFVRAQHQRWLARELSHLDARTLKDIGLEAWKSDLGARVWSQRNGMS